MPEFEEEQVGPTQSESYTPSTDASKRPRTRRRSGGFKTEVAGLTNTNIGEVSATEALKEEKLTGSASAEEEPETEHKKRSDKAPRQAREPKESRRDANPQPSPETLAAIASVEIKIAERRNEREARRAEREKNKPAKKERASQNAKHGRKPAAKKKGLLASILSIFGLGPKEAPSKKKGRQNRGRGGRPKGKGGNRGGQNRGRGGQGRKRGGKGPRSTNQNIAS
ncbi:MAG: hypothetical protein ACPGGN_02990 [Opitutales bacterium]